MAANGAYYQEYGDDKSLIGRTCYEVSHRFDKPCDQCGESCPRTTVIQTGKTHRVLHLHHTSSGEEYVDVELTPLRSADGNIRYFVEAITPLRERSAERPLSGMVGRSPGFNHMLEMLNRVAPHNTTVLLLGESGTGKELAAQTLHQLSQRAARPFVPVDCSGMTEALFESELFGHEKGAFTGATQRKTGLVEASEGGTLFLDELGDIPLNLQVKLLRLLETNSYRRVGGVEILRANFRLVAATHRNLEAMVAEGHFRRDLYYRIAAFPIRIPPLRERKGDLPMIAASLLHRLAPDRHFVLSPAALTRLSAYDFPGNIRELRNILERAIILADNEEIRPEHFAVLHSASSAEEQVSDDIQTLEVMEKRYIEHALARLGGDKDELARQLGISRRTINRKLKNLPDA